MGGLCNGSRKRLKRSVRKWRFIKKVRNQRAERKALSFFVKIKVPFVDIKNRMNLSQHRNEGIMDGEINFNRDYYRTDRSRVWNGTEGGSS
ncbi:hypothetical protein CULT_290048 [[Clostridium] ultunense Esp]|nr:hypothetical protein CULT_290048 [[Clostridium] ultunense Esp]